MGRCLPQSESQILYYPVCSSPSPIFKLGHRTQSSSHTLLSKIHFNIMLPPAKFSRMYAELFQMLSIFRDALFLCALFSFLTYILG